MWLRLVRVLNLKSEEFASLLERTAIQDAFVWSRFCELKCHWSVLPSLGTSVSLNSRFLCEWNVIKSSTGFEHAANTTAVEPQKKKKKLKHVGSRNSFLYFSPTLRFLKEVPFLGTLKSFDALSSVIYHSHAGGSLAYRSCELVRLCKMCLTESGRGVNL